MGYFADRVKFAFKGDSDNPSVIFNSTLIDAARIAYDSVYQAPILLSKEKLDIYYDECNFVYTSDFGVLHLRNPYCQPPPPPPLRDDAPKETPGTVNCNDGTSARILLNLEQNYTLLLSGVFVTVNFRRFTPFDDFTSAMKESANTLFQLELAARLRLTEDYRNITSSIEKRIPVVSAGEMLTVGRFSGNGILLSIAPEAYITYSSKFYQIQSERLIDGQWKPLKENFGEWFEAEFTGLPCEIRKEPPPPPPKKKDKDMDCCPELRALLKLTLKRIGSLPANVPDNFTKQNPTYLNVESLAELLLWQMQQLDALMGAYPIKIEIEDTDLIKEGNQTQKIELPNQAEVLAELLGMVITLKRDTHATLITAVKAMGEAGMTKSLATQTLDVTLANAEFLGYKLDQIKRKVPSLFTPGGANLDETLKEKEVEIISYENTDKNDLQDDLKFLKTMAARWNAQNWRQVTGDPVESLKQTLFGNPDAIKDTYKDNEQGDFNDFTEQAERGFIEVSGITDTVNPWGRPYKERPKIREIGTEKGNYEKDGKERAD